MAIRNEILGGTDWSEEKLTPTDLNDTADGIVAHADVIRIHTTLNENTFSDDFTSDSAATSTNFTYDASADDYTVLGTSAGVLETTTETNAAYPSLIGAGVVNFQYYKFTVFDECSDSSVNTSLWAVSGDGSPSMSEDTDKLDAQTTITNGTFTLSQNGTTYTADQTYAFRTDTGGTLSDSQTVITDGSTRIDLGGCNSTSYIIYVDWTNKNVYYWVNDGSMTKVDISTLSTSYYFEWDGIRSGFGVSNTPHIYMYYFREITGSEATSDPVQSFSADGGSNYSTATNNKAIISTASEQGFDMKAKLTVTPSSGEGVTVRNVTFQGINNSLNYE